MASTSKHGALAFALALAAPGVAGAQDDAAAAPPAADEQPRLHDTALVVGMESLRFRSEDGSRMGIAGPTFAVSYTVGKTWGFALRGAFTLPVRGSQTVPGEGSSNYELGDIYRNQRGSYDALVGVYRRFALNDETTLMLGFGAHARLVGLTDNEYNPVQLIQGGLAGYARIDCNVTEHFFVGAEAFTGVDPLDFVDHRFRAVIAAPMSLSLSIGARR